MRMVLSPGNRHDIAFAEQAVGAWRPRALLGDKGYDSEPLRKWLRNKRIKPVIPGKANRHKKIRHDRAAYKERNVVERLFGRMKEWSCLAMRREKNDSSFFSLLSLFAALDILKKCP